MKYLYYSIYIFYKNVIKVGSYDTPHFYAKSMLSGFQSFAIWMFVNYIYIYLNNYRDVMNTKAIIPFLFYLLIFFINNKVYEKRKEKIIKNLGNKSRLFRNTIHMTSAVIIIILIKLLFSMSTYKRNLRIELEKDYYEIPY